jgi:hypothetical protein
LNHRKQALILRAQHWCEPAASAFGDLLPLLMPIAYLILTTGARKTMLAIIGLMLIGRCRYSMLFASP